MREWEVSLTQAEANWIQGLDMRLEADKELLVNRYDWVGCNLVQYLWTPHFADSAAAGIGIQLFAGAPVRSLYGEIVPDTQDPLQWFADATRGRGSYQSRSLAQFGTPVPGWTDESIRNSIPLLPLWPGFAINTIFYAAILWLLWVAPGKIRRFVRIRGHRCPACGFIIAPNTCANGLCSECGARLPWVQDKSKSQHANKPT